MVLANEASEDCGADNANCLDGAEYERNVIAPAQSLTVNKRWQQNKIILFAIFRRGRRRLLC